MDTTEKWKALAPLLASLEAIGDDGVVALVKVDGLRAVDRFTVVLSGGTLVESPFRMDGDNLQSLLEAALSFYAKYKPPRTS